MSFRPRQFAGSMALLLCLFLGATAQAQVGVGVGGPDGAWIVIGVPGIGAVVQHFPPDDPGASMRALTLPSVPAQVAARKGRLIFLFEIDSPDSATEQGSATQIREVEYQRQTLGGSFVYGPQMPLAPLPIGEKVHGLTMIGPSVFALTAVDSSSGDVRLHHLDGSTWNELALPDAGATSGVWQLLGLESSLAAHVQASKGPSFWRLAVVDPLRWEPLTMGPVEAGRQIIAVGSQVLAVGEEDGAVVVSLVRSERSIEIARLPSRGPKHWIVPVGPNLGVIWSDGSDEPSLTGTILTTTGQILHDGPIRTDPPVGAREMEVLGLLLGSTVLSVAIFIFRPSSQTRRAIMMPSGWVIAEPWRRGLAAGVDAAAALVVASVLWAMPIVEMANPASPRFAEVGIWPLMTAIGILIVVSAVGEATTGRTLGKALCRARTIRFNGRRPRLSQALARNAIKVLCPPLGLVSLMGTPPEASPASFGTLVITPGGEGDDPKKEPGDQED